MNKRFTTMITKNYCPDWSANNAIREWVANALDDQAFTMSMYISKEDLYRAKAEYYEAKALELREELKECKTKWYEIGYEDGVETIQNSIKKLLDLD